jgi:hypothetical protein
LSRWGGLRCPSEHLLLKWSDVDFANGRMTVHSPKTEHHEGKATRLVPIFPELEPLLLEAHTAAPEGDGPVITKYRDSNANLRTQLYRIILRAGLVPWPKLFHNLRSTRETELAERFPITWFASGSATVWPWPKSTTSRCGTLTLRRRPDTGVRRQPRRFKKRRRKRRSQRRTGADRTGQSPSQ